MAEISHMLRKYGLFLLLLPILSWAEPTLDDPCASLLAVLNRPTVADSVCVVKPWKFIAEMGVQYENTYPKEGHLMNLPEAQLRFGLPGSNELTLLPPTFLDVFGSDGAAQSGYTATVLGWKHQFPNVAKFSYSAESIFTLPSGSDAVGSDGLGFAANGIINYSFTDIFSVAMMLGYTTETTSTNSGGDRYSSVNPDVVFTAQTSQDLQFYAEFYGQSKTAPDGSFGFNADAGVQYLVGKNIEVDLEYGQRLSGQLGGFAQYIGTGAGLRF
ncbi:MAG: transporter [Gammaproteobacteria bacterium]